MLPRGLLTFNKKVSWDRHAEERCFALPTLESQQAQREKEGHWEGGIISRLEVYLA